MHHLEDCFRSLDALAYDNFKLLLVDNASVDGSVDYVRSQYPSTEIIRNECNLGFSKGNNMGIRHALSNGAEYVVLLNNDTRVEPDFLDHLVQYGENHPEAGVLGGTVRLHGYPNRINSTGVNLNLLAYGWDRDFGKPTDEIRRNEGEVLAVTGALMAIKKNVFDEIGFLDNDFFAYFEDVDFCIRVWKHTGMTVNYVPHSIVYHKFSASTGKIAGFKKRLMMEGQYRLFFKHYPLWIVLSLFPILFFYHLAHNRSDLSALASECFSASRWIVSLPELLVQRYRTNWLKNTYNQQRFWGKVLKEVGAPKIMRIE